MVQLHRKSTSILPVSVFSYFFSASFLLLAYISNIHPPLDKIYLLSLIVFTFISFILANLVLCVYFTLYDNYNCHYHLHFFPVHDKSLVVITVQQRASHVDISHFRY